MRAKKIMIMICMLILIIGIIYSETSILEVSEEGIIESGDLQLQGVGEGSNIKVDSSNPEEIIEGNLIAAEDTEWLINGKNINAPKGTQVKITEGVMSISLPEGQEGQIESNGINTAISGGDTIKISSLKTGGEIIESEKGFNFDNGKCSTESLGEGKMRIRLDNDGLPTEIENAKVSLIEKGYSLESVGEGYISFNEINCKGYGDYGCLTDEGIELGGNMIMTIDGENDYFKENGFLKLSSSSGTKIKVNLNKYESSSTYAPIISFEGIGNIQNGNLNFIFADGQLLQQKSASGMDGISMEIHLTDYDGEEVIARIDDKELGVMEKLGLSFISPTKTQASEDAEKEYNIYATEEKRDSLIKTLADKWYDVITPTPKRDISDDMRNAIKKYQNPRTYN